METTINTQQYTVRQGIVQLVAAEVDYAPDRPKPTDYRIGKILAIVEVNKDIAERGFSGAEFQARAAIQSLLDLEGDKICEADEITVTDERTLSLTPHRFFVWVEWEGQDIYRERELDDMDEAYDRWKDDHKWQSQR